MRVAIVSDVHGGLAALEAVVEDVRRSAPDLVVHGGDLALHGPRPAEVVDRIRESGWPGVVGNSDELLWRPDEQAAQEARAPKLAGLLHVLFDELAPATREVLGDKRISWLRGLPAEWRMDDLALVHASPGDLWRAPMPEASDDELRRVFEGLGARVAVYGHIHRPFVRKLEGLAVANSGSASLPYDGDARASWLLVSDGHPEVRRVEYDIERDAADLIAVGYPRAEWLGEMRRRGAFIPPER